MVDDRGLGLKSWLSGPERARAHALNRHRVAVLPFASMSPDSGDDYFADGMTEEVISTLSRVPEVEVISRTSVMHYKKDPKPVREVSRELGVGTVLEGSVRKAGNKLRITVQMIDATRERHVWADSYDRELQDVFAIQSEVASRVAQALLLERYGSEASLRKNPTASAEAYSLYLKGRYYWNKRGPENVKTALDCFERAVEEDPGFALGYVGVADCRAVLSSLQIDARANHARSMAMIGRALELDPGLPEANATRGLTLLGEFKLKEAEKGFRTALRLNPSYAPAHLWYYHLLRAELRWSEALEQIERAVALDPLSPNMYLNLAAYYYYSKRDCRTAINSCKRSASLDPGFADAHFFAGRMYGKLKLYDEARREFGRVVELHQEIYPLIGKSVETWLAYLRDEKETVRQLLPAIEADPEESDSDALEIAGFRFYLGDYDRGFDWLERGYSRKDYALIFVQSYLEIPDGVRVDPRYPSFLKKLGLG